MLAADPKECRELASSKALDAGMSSPALCGSHLFLRDDAGVVKCFDLGK